MPSVAQGLPFKGLPKVAKGLQRLRRVAKGCQGLPRVAKGYKRLSLFVSVLDYNLVPTSLSAGRRPAGIEVAEEVVGGELDSRRPGGF